MAHRFTFTVEVEMERTEGTFESRDSMASFFQEALESADPGSFVAAGFGLVAVVGALRDDARQLVWGVYFGVLSIYGDNGGQYDVTTWQVEESA